MDGLNETSGLISFFKILYVLIIFLIILGISYYFSRFIGRRITGRNKLMKHIEALSLGSDKSLHIVQICREFYLISSSQKGIFLLEKLPDSILENEAYAADNDQQSLSFDNYLKNTYDNADFKIRPNIKLNIEKLKKIVKGNKTDE